MDLYFPNLNAACEDVRHLRQVGNELTGQWSLAQILDHLNLSLQMTLTGAEFTFPVLLRPLFRVMFSRTLRVGKPSKLRGKAPKEIQPSADLDEDSCANRFYELCDTLMQPDTKFVDTYPMLGRLNRQQWLRLQQWHCAHHLSFAVPHVSRSNIVYESQRLSGTTGLVASSTTEKTIHRRDL
tara:strand:- start:2723 stop:3268 length:546 start_codon:yes stop_codon:yes gene_type:complete